MNIDVSTRRLCDVFLKRVWMVLFLYPLSTVAQEADPVNESISRQLVLYFRWDKDVLHKDYMGNEQTIAAIDSIFSIPGFLQGMDSVVISATASPEGHPVYNQRLSERRVNTVKRFFLSRFSELQEQKIRTYALGEDWVGLEQRVEADLKVPNRDEVLRLLHRSMPNLERERQLKRIGNGAAYRYINHSILRWLRTGATFVIFYLKSNPGETLFLPPLDVECCLVENPKLLPVQLPVIQPVKMEYRMALNTNLLYDAIGAFNIGVEFIIGKTSMISTEVDVAYSYWRLNNLYALQTIQAGAEMRYWFSKPRETDGSRNPEWSKPLRGWYAGIYYLWCHRYDWQVISGMQGDGFWSAGVSGGYAFPVGKNLTLQAGISFGYLRTPEVRYYDRPMEGRLMFSNVESNKMQPLYIPTKAGLSFVWLVPFFQSKSRKQ